MVYEIQHGPMPPHQEDVERRGRKAEYPIKAMQINEWITVPCAEGKRLFRAVRHVKRTRGYKFVRRIDHIGMNWLLLRVE